MRWTEPCNFIHITSHLTSTDKSPRQVIQSSSQVPRMYNTPFLMACSVFPMKVKICTPLFNKKARHASSLAGTPRDLTRSHSAPLFSWRGWTFPASLQHRFIYFFFFSACLYYKLAIANRKDDYLNLWLEQKKQKHRAVVSVTLFCMHTCAFYCTAELVEDLILRHKAIGRT